MSGNIARLKAKRAGQRGVCTKYIKELDELLVSSNSQSKTRINVIKDLLEEKCKVLNVLDEDILDICEVDDIENEIEESTEITARIYHALSLIDNYLKPSTNSETSNKENEIVNESIENSTNKSSESVHGTHGAQPESNSTESVHGTHGAQPESNSTESVHETHGTQHELTNAATTSQRVHGTHDTLTDQPNTSDGAHGGHVVQTEQLNTNKNSSKSVPGGRDTQHDSTTSKNAHGVHGVENPRTNDEQSPMNEIVNTNEGISTTSYDQGVYSTPINRNQTIGINEPTNTNSRQSLHEFSIDTKSSMNGTFVKTKLPKLTLPRFKGETTKWNTFWDSYESAIHCKEDISKIDKFNYLNSLLEGSAARAIQGLTLSNANYDAAIEILQERFGRPQQIIAAHMDELLKVPVSSCERTSSLRFLYDKISVHVRGLASLGVSAKQYGSLLIPIIMSKLPSEIRIEVARKTSNEVWDIDELLKIIQTEIDARELSDKVLTTSDSRRSSNSQGTPSHNKPFKSSMPHRQATTSTFVSNEGGYKPPQCVYCNEQHFSASCEKIKDVTERKSLLMKNGRCFLCLKKGDHKVSDCKSSKTCRFCNSRHHQSICNRSNAPQRGEVSRSSQSTLSNNGSNDQITHQHVTVSGHGVTAHSQSKTTVLLQTARAIAINPSNGQSMNVRILFDSGSQRTYVTDELKNKLNLDTLYQERLNLNTFGENNYKKRRCDAVSLQLQRPGCSEVFNIKCLSFPTICTPVPSMVKVDLYPHLHGLEVSDNYNDDHGTIDILIGVDYYWNFMDGELIHGDSGPTAMSSKFGWILSGPLQLEDSVTSGCVVTNLIISDYDPLNSIYKEKDDLNSTLKKFWDTESIGIVDNNALNGCEQQARKQFESLSIQRNGDRYEVDLPWLENGPMLQSDHYQLSLNRLKGLQRRLQSKPELCKEYDNIIRDQLDKDIIEKVNSDESQPQQLKGSDLTKNHYLPHHGVIREERITSKLRVVYDGSARDNNQDASINDCLDTGPNLVPKLFDILVKFRWNHIALTADIEKAFLMIGITKQDRDFLRFLWFKDPLDLNSEIEQFRFTRLVFGLRSSPAVLSSTILHHLQLYKHQCPEIVDLLSNYLYVDDLVTGSDSEEKAYEIYKVSKQIMSEGGFNLRKWNSNSSKLNKLISLNEQGNNVETTAMTDLFIEDDESYAKTSTGSNDNATHENHEVKLLGITWNSQLDEFLFGFSDLLQYAKSLSVTKRSLLKFSAKIYDPLGFLSPFVIRLKILFQELCINKVNWDDPLIGNDLNEWNTIITELKQSSIIHLPRCYFRLNYKPETIELHSFSDASSKAYASVVYIRSVYPDGNVSINLLASKTKVAPIKKQSIPRLELLGAYILSRLVNTIIQSLSCELPVYYWVDSMTVLCWIKNERPWKQYVRDRVKEIRRLTAKESWRFCPGTLNPADLPTRGLPISELSTNEVWWHGPHFLKMNENNWPSIDNNHVTTESAESEVLKATPRVYHSLYTANPSKMQLSLDDIIDCNNFSTLNRLLRVTSYVLRFVNNVKVKLQLKKSKRNRHSELKFYSGTLTSEEIHNAENNWIRTVQGKQFKFELECLLSKSTSNSRVLQFGLYLDDQDHVIKCKGRLDNVKLSAQALNPILLGSNHPFVHLIILNYHERCFHGGVNNTLTYVRERFWIIHGRQIVKQLCKLCIICKKIQGLSYKSPPTGNLPSFRVSDDPPFTHTGVDFAGPLFITNDNQELKSYVCLFTCASTRAIHLELTRTLNVKSFLQAFRRFISRRGVPASMISDNAKTFKSSSLEIRKICRSTEVQQYLTNNQITWRFIVEKASWWGGFYERMVQSVKRTLRKVIGRSSLHYDELNTLLVETESIINARPLTYVEDDQDGLSYALTPSHLIYGRRIANSPNAIYFEVTSTYTSLTRRLQHHQRLLLQFTSIWRSDYLSKLRENQAAKLRHQRCSSSTVSKGDVVVLKNDSTKRTFWKLAVVEELLRGEDGNVRAVVIRVLNNKGRIIRLRRSVKHIYPIEVSTQDDSETDQNKDTAVSTVDKQQNLSTQQRPRREAAIVGEQKRKLLGH